MSPSIAGLLPHLMRIIADELEREVGVQPASLDLPAAGPRQSLASLDGIDLHSLANQVASGLSVTLSQHLVRSVGSDIAGGRVPVAAGQLEQQATSRLASQSGDRPPARGRLRLKLLGSPEITLDGVRLKALERCTRASLIIYVLALHRRGLSSERLAACIASDSGYPGNMDSEKSIRLGAVRTFIWRLRKLAGWSGVVVTPEDQGGYESRYRLPDDTVCDVWDFEARLDEAARFAVRANTDPAAADRAAALRQDAILLYRGEFCMGIGADSMADAAEYLRQRYLQAVLLQASYWKDRATALQRERQTNGVATRASVQEESAWLEALSNYRLATQVEPYDEAAYAGVMMCQAHLGQRQGVQKTLARCAQVLRDELDREPHSTTIGTAENCLRMASQVGSVPHVT